MDAQWVGVALTAIAVVVSLAVFIRSVSTQLRAEFRSEMQSFRQEMQSFRQEQREEIRALAAQQREDHRELSDKLTGLAERTTRIEEALVPRSSPILQTAAQSLLPTE